jgi:MFS family permease
MSLLIVGLPWGMLSDNYGRKPIVVYGILATIPATLMFGFSKSFALALIARTIAGLFNGNVSVIRTMVADSVVERSHQAKAFSVMPFIGNAGSILGPVIGGAYANYLLDRTDS